MNSSMLRTAASCRSKAVWWTNGRRFGESFGTSGLSWANTKYFMSYRSDVLLLKAGCKRAEPDCGFANHIREHDHSKQMQKRARRGRRRNVCDSPLNRVGCFWGEAGVLQPDRGRAKLGISTPDMSRGGSPNSNSTTSSYGDYSRVFVDLFNHVGSTKGQWTNKNLGETLPFAPGRGPWLAAPWAMVRTTWHIRNPAPLGNHGNHCFLVFTGESSFQGFLGGAGFRPSTVVTLSPPGFNWWHGNWDTQCYVLRSAGVPPLPFSHGHDRRSLRRSEFFGHLCDYICTERIHGTLQGSKPRTAKPPPKFGARGTLGEMDPHVFPGFPFLRPFPWGAKPQVDTWIPRRLLPQMTRFKSPQQKKSSFGSKLGGILLLSLVHGSQSPAPHGVFFLGPVVPFLSAVLVGRVPIPKQTEEKSRVPACSNLSNLEELEVSRPVQSSSWPPVVFWVWDLPRSGWGPTTRFCWAPPAPTTRRSSAARVHRAPGPRPRPRPGPSELDRQASWIASERAWKVRPHGVSHVLKTGSGRWRLVRGSPSRK